MFSHVMLGTDNIYESKLFYDSIMAVLGYSEGVMDTKGRCLYIGKLGVFGLTKPINGEKASSGNGMTIGFSVDTPAQVKEWHRVGLTMGGAPCDDPPGIRHSNGRQLYLTYLRDPTGNKLCATHFVND